MIIVGKFGLELRSGPQPVGMQRWAKIVHVHVQDSCPMDRELETRTFHVYATGEPIDLPVYRYVGTVHVGWTVWHVYESAVAS